MEKQTVAREEVFQYIKEKYPEDDLCHMVDSEAMEWLDDDWETEYDDALEWYANCGGGEAESEVRKVIAKSVNDKFNINVEQLFDFGEMLEELDTVISWTR